MQKAIVLDFSSVILHGEPIHHAAMREAFADSGIVLTRQAKWHKIHAGRIGFTIDNCRPREALKTANRVVTSLEEAKLESLITFFEVKT